ncbi:hypothetical protein [Luteimonas saliphila]|uniref:hypothetical protein n=1 Tax=Luteimonas saliphila TaxID=2804919 RepID=UPI00192E0BF2|nr:hypothetical protein [Luteimonas saliphila]
MEASDTLRRALPAAIFCGAEHADRDGGHALTPGFFGTLIIAMLGSTLSGSMRDAAAKEESMLPTINRPSVLLAVLSLGLLGAMCVIPPASAQLIDAGGQANLMQQHALMRNQSTGDGPDWIDREAVRKKRASQQLAHAPAHRPIDEAAMEADMRRMIDQRRRELLPEYERRVRSDGRPSADRWLRQVATEMGRRDGAAIRAKYGQ